MLRRNVSKPDPCQAWETPPLPSPSVLSLSRRRVAGTAGTALGETKLPAPVSYDSNVCGPRPARERPACTVVSPWRTRSWEKQLRMRPGRARVVYGILYCKSVTDSVCVL
eukprot:gene25604-biopygen7504